ncbi:MAG: MurT ligase domain-containing protein [Leucobacter sp.]
MRDLCSAVVGKAVRAVARLRGGGSALPGLVVERFDPGFMGRVLADLPLGVVAVSGTNGKTTTTKMIVEMLEAQGHRVFTNRTGSNYSRGVVAAMIEECSILGKLDADVAVLELDEAHAMYFINRVKPRFTLLLNVLRDQLDRFGEIDTTAAYLQRIADATLDVLVVNREDRLVAEIGARTRARAGVSGRPVVIDFGLTPDLLATFPGDDDFHGASTAVDPGDDPRSAADVTLMALGKNAATFLIDGLEYETPLLLEGLYNTYNAAAAVAMVRAVQGASEQTGEQASISSILESLAAVRPAFGRGEKLELDGQPLELVLVKNPAGFRLGLASFEAAGVGVMIAINDQYADGRDMSWLWDVDFTTLETEGVAVVSGTRAWDMALRLEHDDVSVEHVEEDFSRAINEFRRRTPGKPRRIYCSYTAMMGIRKRLSELTDVEEI